VRLLDLTTHGGQWLALLPESILALAAMAILMHDAFSPRGERGRGAGTGDQRASVEYLIAMYGIAAAFIASLWLGDATAPTDGLIAVDGFRITANLILLGGAALVLVISRDYLAREGVRTAEFHALVLLALVGMLVLVAARDLILLFVGLELMSIAVYVLTGFVREDPRSSEASLKYFIVGAFASAFLVYGIALLYGATGTTRLATAGAAIAASAAGGGDLLLTAGVGLLIVGFAFKIAAVPFHMWTPDAYEGAPTPVTAFMATGVKAAAFVALLRILTVDLAGASDIWRGPIWWLAILTMIVPNMIALAQNNVKRMLAYSSVAHAGYLLVGVAAASALGRAASLFYLAAYTVMTVGSFAIIYHVAGKGDRRGYVDDYRGLGWKRPWLAFALVVFLLSLAGFPPTAGFVGKLYLLRAAVAAGETVLAVTLVLTSLIAYYYYLRIVWKMYFASAEDEAELPADPTPSFRWAMVVCVVALILGGLFPGPVIERTRDAIMVAAPSTRATISEPTQAAASEPARSDATSVQSSGPSPDVLDDR